MSNDIVVEGVTVSDLSLTASGSGPGCTGATILPSLTEETIDKSNHGGKKILKQLEAKIICPGTGGASQSDCTAAKVQSNKIEKGNHDGADIPLCVGDMLVGGVCNGTYPVGNSTSNCTCSFTIEIKKSQQDKLSGD